MLNIFLSSPYRGLTGPRWKILDKLDTVFEGVGMEKFIPNGSNSQEVCIHNLKRSDIIIFIISPYYGSLMETCSIKEECKAECPMKSGEGQISYTHCEYKNAIAEGILHQTYLALEGWDAQDVPKEALLFKREIGKEMWVGIHDIKDPNLVKQICNNLATKIIDWHTQDKLNFSQFCDREKVLNEIIENIDSKIEVWGVGGVGKTALIQVALLVQKLKGKTILTIGTSKSYASGSGFENFRTKCRNNQYIADFHNEITIHDVINAFAANKLLRNAEDLIKMPIDKKIMTLSKIIKKNENLILFLDDFHLATENVSNLAKSVDHIILSSRRNTYISRKEIYLSGIEEKDREHLIKLFSAEIPESKRKLISKIAEGHPVSTEMLVKNYQNIDFDKIKDFDLAEADDNQVKDFYKRVIEEIFSNNSHTLNLLKDLAIINTDLPTNIDKESVLKSYEIENSRKAFKALVDTGMLKKRESKEATYEFYFKHIQDALEDIADKESHEKAIKYYEKKKEIIKENMDDAVETLYHKVKLSYTEELLNKFLEIKKKIQPVHYGFKRLIDVGEELMVLVEDQNKTIIMMKLGLIFADLGRFEEAEHSYKEALRINKMLANKNPKDYLPKVADAQNNLGVLYDILGRPDEAEHAYKEALEIIKKIAKKNPEKFLSKVADTQNNLGILYRTLGRFKDAEYMYKKALEKYNELTNENREAYLPDLAMTQNNLGNLYNNLRRFEYAECMYKKALEIRKELAEKNPELYLSDVAETQNNLGVLYDDLGRFEDAEHAFKEALEIIKRLANKNPEVYLTKVGGTQINLGVLYIDLKRFGDAEKNLNSALKIFKELTKNNLEAYLSNVAETQDNLGVLYQKLGRFDKANLVYTEALEIRKKLAEKNPEVHLSDVAETQNNLGILYVDLGRFEEAEQVYTEALKIFKDLTENSPEAYLSDVAETQNNLGVLYSKLGKFKKAEDVYIEALEIRKVLAEKNPGVYLSDVAETQNNLGVLYQKLGRFDEVLEMTKEILNHQPENIDALANKGYSLIFLKKYDKASESYDAILKIDPNFANAWYNKACIESLKNNKLKALEFLKKAVKLDFKYKTSAEKDGDFANIKDLKEFKEIIEKKV